MFSRKQRRSLYQCISKHGLSINSFAYNDDSGDFIVYNHISTFYFKVYVGHERATAQGVEPLLTVESTPLRARLAFNEKKSQLQSMIEDWTQVVELFNDWLKFLADEFDIEPSPVHSEEDRSNYVVTTLEVRPETTPLAHLHPTVQQAADALYAGAHYPEAILKTCTALDKAVAAKAQRPDLNGKQLMDVAFTPNNPLLRLSQDKNEQTGFMLLYQGVMQAIRNHYAHHDTAIDANRALEWLSFLSALFCKLDESAITLPPATS